MIEYLGKLKTEFENLLTFKNRGQKSRDTLPFTLHSITVVPVSYLIRTVWLDLTAFFEALQIVSILQTK